MSMPIEAFMPCIGTVDVCVVSTEENVPIGCCPTGISSPKIITYGADFKSVFTINYTGPLFGMLSSTNNWVVEVWLEEVGGLVDANLQDQFPIPHAPSSLSGTVTFSNDGTAGNLVAGRLYKPVYKVELRDILTGALIVCGFTEGDIFHAGEMP